MDNEQKSYNSFQTLSEQRMLAISGGNSLTDLYKIIRDKIWKSRG